MEGRRYKIGDEDTRIICYADDAVLFIENEDDLHKLTHIINTTGTEGGSNENLIPRNSETKNFLKKHVKLYCRIRQNAIPCNPASTPNFFK